MSEATLTSPNELAAWREAQRIWVHLIRGLHLVPEAPIVDIGAGSSMMVDTLLAHGFTNLTAVDVSTSTLARTRQRVGAGVDLVVADVREYRTDVPVALWHDRVVFHDLAPAERTRYRENLHASLAADGHAVIDAYASSPAELAEELDLRLETGGRRDPVTVAVLAR